MGAWGHGPFDNDAASDVIDAVLKPIRKISWSKKPEHEEVIAAVHTLLMFKNIEALESAIYAAEIWPTVLRDRLKSALNDKDWMESWEDPSAVKANIRRDLRKLNKWIDSGCFDN